MKIRIELDKDEHLEDADAFLTKAMSAKQECSGGEHYADDYLNEFESYICSEHEKVLKQITEDILAEVKSSAHF